MNYKWMWRKFRRELGDMAHYGIVLDARVGLTYMDFIEQLEKSQPDEAQETEDILAGVEGGGK